MSLFNSSLHNPLVILNFFDTPSSYYVASGSITFQNSKIYDKYNNTHLNILVVDDEELCRMSIKMMLMGTNHNVIFADGGYPALSYLNDNASVIDLVILDLMMPDLHGIHVTQVMKTKHIIKDIPILISTGSSNEEEIGTVQNCGANDIVKKPYQKAALVNAISKFKSQNR